MIETIRQMDEQNYLAVRQRLGETASLLEDVGDCYSLTLAALENANPRPDKALFMATVHFILETQRQLVVAGITMMCGHLSESFSATRRAIEICGHTDYMHRHPELVPVWRDSWQDEAKRKEYRKHFGNFRAIMSRHDTVLDDLYERFAYCSNRAHPSWQSMAGRFSTITQDDRATLRLGYFEISQADESEPARTLLWTVQTHRKILDVFARRLADDLDSVRTEWDDALQRVNDKFFAHRQHWAPILEIRDNTAS